MNKLSVAGLVGALLTAATAVVVTAGPAQAATLNLTPTADTYVQADQPAVNFGTSVRWSTEGRANIWRNSLLRFQVQVPAGEEVKTAKLRAVSEAAATATEFVDVYTTATGWTETGVTWQNAPARGTWLTKTGGFALGATVEWDVTGGVAKTGGDVNLKLESNAQKWLGFKSKEHATPALRPVLVVETGPVTPPTTTTTPPPTTTTTPPPPPPGSVKIAAVGDMNPSGNTSTTSPSGKNAAAIIAALNSGGVSNFVGIGDFQYEKGTCTALNSQWKTLWGGAIPKTYWTTGPNHDIEPGVNDDVDKFFNGECAGSTAISATNTTKGGFVDALDFYSFDVGTWHFAVTPTAAWRYDVAKANAITGQLDTDLAAAKAAGKNLAVIYHDPYFTSSTSSHARETLVKPWVDIMWKHRVKLTLSGSQHNYERSCPVNNADQCVTDGMTAFQVSTGGIGLRTFTSNPAYIVKKFSDTWGHLVLTLNNDGSFGWEFVPVAGGMQTDSGTRAA